MFVEEHTHVAGHIHTHVRTQLSTLLERNKGTKTADCLGFSLVLPLVECSINRAYRHHSTAEAI